MTQPNAILAAAIAKAKQAEDQSQVKEGGGDFAPPAAGKTAARLVGYFELGLEDYDYKGTIKTRNRVRLVFELIGKKHPPIEVKVGDATVLIPVRMTLNVNKSFGSNGNWTKLFGKLNYDGGITHAAERLGQAFLVEVVHNTVAGTQGKPDKTYGNLTNAAGEFLIGAPRVSVVDEESGDVVEKPLNVGPAITEPKCFLWDYCDKAMWDSIFIDGEFPERKDAQGNVTSVAKSKNVLQNEIKAAKNYIGSPIYDLLAAGGSELDIADAETVVRTTPPPAADVAEGAADPLDSM